MSALLAPAILQFARPELLWGLLGAALPLVLRRGAGVPAGAGETASPWARAVDPELLPLLLADAGARADAAAPPPTAQRGRLAIACEVLVAILLVLALAGPRWQGIGEPQGATGLRPDAARVVLVDLSPAFGARPAAEQERLRGQLRAFVRALPPGESALAVYAGSAWLVVPPTEDTAAFEAFIDELATDAVPVAGDRAAAGFALARQVLAATGARQRTIFWLPAGSGPAVEAWSADAVAVVTLPPEGMLDAWLAAAAVVATAATAARPVGWTASRLDPGEPAGRGGFDCGPLLVLLALPLIVFRLSGRIAPHRNAAILAVLLAAAGSGTAPPSHAEAARRDFDDGVAHYRAGRFADAAIAFGRAGEADPRATYNRGNALARAGRLHDALAAYDASLRVRPGDADTLYNRDLVARLLAAPESSPRSKPPPPSAPPPPDAAAREEAARAADQWLRRPPADLAGLLKRKLALDEARTKTQSGTQAMTTPAMTTPAMAGPDARPGDPSPARPREAGR